MSMITAVQFARKALELAWDGTLPVKPEDIARGLVVFKNDPATGTSTQIPIVVRALNTASLEGASGQASLLTEGGKTYFACDYNADEISYRNRFTIAHELGHVLLGHVNEGTRQKRDTSFGNSNPIERDANTFAAELVMPEQKVRDLWPGARSIQQMAEAFGVSNAAMSYRLTNLGLNR